MRPSLGEHSQSKVETLLRLGLVAALITGCGAQVRSVTGDLPHARPRAPQVKGVDPRCPTLTFKTCDIVQRSDATLSAAQGILGRETVDQAQCPEVLAAAEHVRAQLSGLWNELIEVLDSYGLSPHDQDALYQRVNQQRETVPGFQEAIQRIRSQCGPRGQ